jgi:TfoX/Sxy family transcriptional regulator of competence genes
MKGSAQDHLIDRIRLLIEGDPRIQEKRMFGGLSFLLNGHILIAARKDGSALLSVGKEHNDEAMSRPGTVQMVHGGRVMRGFVFVDGEALEEDDDLRDWVRTAERWVAAMPVKDAVRKKPAVKAATWKRPPSGKSSAEKPAPKAPRNAPTAKKAAPRKPSRPA